MTQAAQVVEAIAFFIAFVLTQPCVHALNGYKAGGCIIIATGKVKEVVNEIGIYLHDQSEEHAEYCRRPAEHIITIFFRVCKCQ